MVDLRERFSPGKPGKGARSNNSLRQAHNKGTHDKHQARSGPGIHPEQHQRSDPDQHPVGGQPDRQNPFHPFFPPSFAFCGAALFRAGPCGLSARRWTSSATRGLGKRRLGVTA